MLTVPVFGSRPEIGSSDFLQRNASGWCPQDSATGRKCSQGSKAIGRLVFWYAEPPKWWSDHRSQPGNLSWQHPLLQMNCKNCLGNCCKTRSPNGSYCCVSCRIFWILLFFCTCSWGPGQALNLHGSAEQGPGHQALKQNLRTDVVVQCPCQPSCSISTTRTLLSYYLQSLRMNSDLCRLGFYHLCTPSPFLSSWLM